MAVSPSSRARLRLFGAAAGVAALGLLAVWAERGPVTDAAVRRYLAAKGVVAVAETVEVGRRRLVFEHVRLGPASAPELTARRVVVDFNWSALRPAIAAIRLEGAVLRVRADRGGIAFGSLDRLIPPGRSTRFPAVRLDAPDARIVAATPVGVIDLRLAAAGRLDRDFRAAGTVAPVTLRSADCVAMLPGADFVVTTRAEDFAISGRGRLLEATCGGVTVPSATWQARLAAPLTMTRLDADAAVNAPVLRSAGIAAAGIVVTGASAGPVGALRGRWTAGAAGLTRGPDRVGAVAAAGTLTQTAAGSLHSDGSLTARAVQPATVRAMLPSAARLPTLAATLIARADAALRNVDLRAAFAADIGAVTRLHVNSLDLSGAQGARLQLTGIDWTPADTQFDGTAVFGGGGLPAVVAAAAGRASSSAGRFTVAPWHAGGNAFGLTAGRFAITPAQVEAAAIVQLSTTVGGSRIEGLTLPLTARFDRLTGTLALGDGCLRAGLQRAAFGTAQLGATAVQLCPARPGPLATLRGGRLTAALAVGALALNGRARERSFRLTAAPFRLDLNGRLDAPVLAVPGIDLAGASGAWAAAAHLAVQARSTARGWAGAATVSGLRAGGPAVTASAGRARAKLANGIVSVDGGSIALADPGVIPAFNPLRLTDIAARLDGRSASGRGSVRLADGTTLATVRADYDLEQAKGHADITSELTFTPKLQPVDISGAVRGLVANVTGTATGAATLTIEGGRLGGSGSVRLAGVSLATAALGPVTGIDGTVAFDDIVALHTPPHQSLHVAALNPGIEIENIALLFQLRGRDTLAVERIAWPFTGGTMTVRPTVLRAGASRRTFTVDVDGLDAEQFLQRFEIKNLSATGRFDGTLPLAFEGASGRIVGGVLTARASGGVLQYVGEVGQASMGAAGRLAFDALRRLRYRTLRLSLDGDLDAEIVTGIDFTGTNEVPLTTGSRLPVRATGLPFKFGVTVRAPFRALLGTAASLGDARAVIRAAKAAP